MLLIAVQGCTLQVITTTPTVPGTATIPTPPSTKVKAGGAFIYRGIVQCVVKDVTEPGWAQTTPATGIFTVTSTKVKVDGQFVLRQTDQATDIEVELQQTSSPFNKKTVIVNVIVSVAGQTKVLAN